MNSGLYPCTSVLLYLLRLNVRPPKHLSTLASYSLLFTTYFIPSTIQKANPSLLSEPCIRGHRSTKCSHANERLMVPVRKPGRPLSLCPHPPSRQCGCAGVTAAIPRKQTCGCGTSKPKASKDGAPSQAASPSKDTAPGSPKSGAGSSSFRVRKTSKPASRKASIDPSGIERMDASQVNILPAFDVGQTSSASVHNNMSTSPANGFSPMPISPHHASPVDAMMMPFYPQHVSSPALGQSMQQSPANGHPMSGTSQPSSSGHTSQMAPSPPTNASGGCCSGSGSGVVTPELKKGNCCPSNSHSSQQKSIPNGGHNGPPQMQHPGSAMMTPSMTPSMTPGHQPYSPYFPHPTIFHYPPNYGSYLQPLLPELWKQAMTSMMAQTLGTTNAMGTPDLGFIPSGTPTTPSLGSSHVCTCGDGCQCIGCAAHPYNNATQNYVRSAWNSMMDETWANGITSPLQGPAPFHARNPPANVNGHHTMNGQPCAVSSGVPNGGTAPPNTSTTAVSEPTNEPGGTEAETTAPTPAPPAASPTPQTPSDTASGASDEQTLSASDFFFVTYPFGESCLGDTASCPCGDDCQCLGCVVHGNSAEGVTES